MSRQDKIALIFLVLGCALLAVLIVGVVEMARVEKQELPPDEVVIRKNCGAGHCYYTFEDDGCIFLFTGGGLIHHPTCKNPKHRFKQ